jgi:Flp pilus assembly pilin Flp
VSRRGVLLGLIAVLYVISIPWYRTPGAPSGFLLGLPDWVAVALLCYVGVAIMNALAWFWTDVSDDPEAPR